MSLMQRIGNYVCVGALALGVGCSTKHIEIPDYQPEPMKPTSTEEVIVDFPKTPANVLYANTLGRVLEDMPSMINQMESIARTIDGRTASLDSREGTIGCSNYDTIIRLLDTTTDEIYSLAEQVRDTYERSSPHEQFPRERVYDLMIDELREVLDDLEEARKPFEEACE